ncbi:ATP phosphoribosyltransferase regulatory subunit (modular protein) [Nitrospira japonica]|uniref:ATP phosphoribosyltransferase regulatory subunit n=1 Tax=Nitrospira japonica TaxID=1325564 RepID=A0A1W1I0A4_9BACT|nr:ATP phosphoribosyltransferase regulatory subunit [Nitrospira japonica]SLM46435.1 ATP phosphoribosyltransferase regulatory subunit (modular protein) [Nitrospira japonica]
MATILPHAARQVRHLEGQLLAQIGRWGYDEIILPTFEYLDVLAPGLETELLETCYQFIDRTTGRTLLLRPDATAQVARTVAMGLTGARFPQRLAYRTSVFRYEPEHAGRGREIFQIGAELIGLKDVTGDAEVITILIECLQSIGLRSFTIALGHVGFIKGLMARSGLSVRARKRAEQAAARKDLPRLEEILKAERIARSTAMAIREAPELTGRKEVLTRGRALAAGDSALLEPLERLAELYQLLCSAGYEDAVLLDLGEFRGVDYYDGAVFDVFAPGVGAELGGGGRYDHLIGRFGADLPSTGFALDVDRLFRAVAFPEETEGVPRIDYLVIGPQRAMSGVSEVAAQLRRRQFRVAQQIVNKSPRRLLTSAVQQGQAQGARAVVVIGMPGQNRSDEFTVIERAAHRTNPARNGRPSVKKMNLAALIKATQYMPNTPNINGAP